MRIRLPPPSTPPQGGGARATTHTTAEHAKHAARVDAREDEERAQAQARAERACSTEQLQRVSREAVLASAPPKKSPRRRNRQSIAMTASSLSGALACQALLQGKLAPEAFAETVSSMPGESTHAWMLNFGSCLVRLGGTLSTLRRQRDAALESNNRALLHESSCGITQCAGHSPCARPPPDASPGSVALMHIRKGPSDARHAARPQVLTAPVASARPWSSRRSERSTSRPPETYTFSSAHAASRHAPSRTHPYPRQSAWGEAAPNRGMCTGGVASETTAPHLLPSSLAPSNSSAHTVSHPGASQKLASIAERSYRRI